ncbi:MAG: hypothetical protein JWN72_1948, partial [Thermoleophilia bacterium]|nr:hypothetical protein [Thermoleophilia bacterium]
MDIASYDVLDFDLAWKRLLKWARDGQIDTTDRLPFEAMDKLYPGSPPRVDRTHHLRPVEVI